MEKRYCPEHGLELEASYEKNRYYYNGPYGDTLLGEDFDEKTGERLYCIVGRCPVKQSNGLKALFRMKQESHYIKLIEKDAKMSQP